MDAEMKKWLESLPRVPDAAATAYIAHLGELVEQVNRIMAARTDIYSLIGNNPLSVMFDNHRNHGMLVRTVLALDQWDLLIRNLAWVYRACRNQGFDFFYFPVQYQAWQQAMENLLPPDAEKALRPVYEWMAAHHAEIIAASRKPQQNKSRPDPQWRGYRDDFLQALLRGDRNASMDIARDCVADAQQLQQFYLRVVQPAMYAVGELWEKGDISVAKEHLASAIANRVLAGQYVEVMESAQQERGRVLVTAAPNEFHEIGPTMVANCLEADGWRVEYLGANTPAEELLHYAYSGGFDVIAISAAMAFALDSVKEMIRSIRSWPENMQPRILLGGMVFADFPGLPEKLGADGYASDCREAVEMLRHWQGGGSA